MIKVHVLQDDERTVWASTGQFPGGLAAPEAHGGGAYVPRPRNQNDLGISSNIEIYIENLVLVKEPGSRYNKAAPVQRWENIPAIRR
jgi:hypothetical protein